MPVLRSRRLERLLDAPIDGELSYERIQALVVGGAREDFDLDFKRDMYKRSDSDRRALCSDVAAMANTAGGLILIGVDEDEHAQASSLVGVPVSDDAVQWICQTLAGGLSPLPPFEVIPVADPNRDDGTGVLAVAIGHSPLRPHAVRVNEGWRWPKRNGPTITYLAEPEVAETYLNRFWRLQGRAGAVAEQEESLLHRLAHDGRTTWLVVTLVPEVPGDFCSMPNPSRRSSRRCKGSGR